MRPEHIEQRLAETPTTAALKARQSARKEYWFFLTSRDVATVADLGDAAVLAYAVIRAAAWGPRADQWVTVSPRAREALNRGYRWWHRTTTRLHDLGVIDVQRLPGRAPRYRLRVPDAEPCGQAVHAARPAGSDA